METVAMQVTALTHQNQLTTNTAANTSQRNQQQFAQLNTHQNMMHENLHQIIAQVSALTFNASNQGQGTVWFSGHKGYGSRSRERGHSGPRGHGCTPAPPPGAFQGSLGSYQGGPTNGPMAGGPQP
jgi:hypothetical protein